MSNTPIFNLNTDSCFDLQTHMNYFIPLNNETQVVRNPIEGTVAFAHNTPRKVGGMKLQLATIPDETYHIFITAAVVIGSRVTMTSQSKDPKIRLFKPQTWRIGCQEVRTMCFRPLNHRTDLIFETEVDCNTDLTPFQFTILNMSVIPDSLMCQGYIRGTTGDTGATGHVGPTGIIGPNSLLVQGPQGSLGETGPTGSIGEPGFKGDEGLFGVIGGIGPPGSSGADMGSDGPTGDVGLMGNMGVGGATGPPGVTGIQGTQGGPGIRSGDNLIFSGENLTWTRGGPNIASNLITFQILGDSQVTINITDFSSFGIFGINSTLTSSAIPTEIRTLAGQSGWFTAVVEVDGVSRQVIIRIGPSNIIIYSDINLSTEFSPSELVRFPTQSFTYYKN